MAERDPDWHIVERYVADLRDGVEVDPEAVVAAHPEAGPALRASLDAARTIAGLSRARAVERYALALRPVAPARYERTSLLGRGGMGVVLRVHDASLGRDVAIKTLPPGPPQPPSADAAAGRTRVPLADPRDRDEARLRREARLTAALEHPGVPPVYEVGESSGGTPYYAMRLVARDRRTLATELARLEGRRFEARIPLLDAFLRVCDTVAYAHAKGIVHRDLKPANVVIGDYGVVFVVDWGLAKWRAHPDDEVVRPADDAEPLADDGDLGLTRKGSVLGTPGYLSPEAATGNMSDVDERSEVFTLGVMLFEILTGRLPFRFATGREYAAQVRSVEPPEAVALDPAVPRSLSDLCHLALARDRARRPASVEALASGIRDWRARSDAEREALRLLAEAKGVLDRAASLPPEDARRAVSRARALVESLPALVADHPELAAVRADCDRVTTVLDLADRRRWGERDARRRRNQLRGVVVAVLLAAGLAAYREHRSREQGQEDARRDATLARRAAIDATIAEMGRVGLGASANDFEYLLRLVRDADAQTVDSVARALDAISDELAAARDRALREPEPAGLEADERVARAQLREVGTGRQRTADLLCEALGLIRIVEGAAPALGRHLAVRYDLGGPIHAGLALARLASTPKGGAEALAALRVASSARKLDVDPEFRARVLAFLPVGYDGASRPPPMPDAPLPPPRRVHGVLPDPASGADWLIPAYVESWMGLGLPLDNRREVRDEIRAFSARLELAPMDAAAWLNRAEARRYGGDLAGAEADQTRAIELAPLDPVPRERRASVRRLQGNHRGALDDYDAALERSNEPARVLLFRGITWVDLGDGERALRDLDAVIASGKTRGAAYSYSAMARLGLGDLAGAERDALLATQAIPENSEARNALVVARLLLGRPQEALAAVREASSQGDAYYLGWNTLAVARCLTGDPAGARAALLEANRIDARLPFAWVNLGICDLREKNAAAAVRHFEWAIERGGARLAASWLGLAIASRDAGDPSRARRAMEVFRLLAPDDRRGVDPATFAPDRRAGR